MYTKRIIPCLDVNKGRVVKGTNFVELKDAGNPVELATRYGSELADELVFLDITASYEQRETIIDIAQETSSKVFIPFTVGGGIRTTKDIKKLLRAGADKISLNTAAVKKPELISEGAEIYGRQCIVLAVDARKTAPNCWEVYIDGGKTSTGLDVISWVKYGVELGAGEILLTSMDKDGTKDGYDIELTRTVAETVSVPVIASGGAGKLEDFYEVLTAGRADAVLAASVFHYQKFSIREVKRFLQAQGLEVRL